MSTHRARARDQHRAGRPRRANERTVASQPKEQPRWREFGLALIQHGRLEEAVAFYRQALENRPDDPEIHNDLGVALGRLGHLDEAVRSFEHSLHLAPNNLDARCNLGVLLVRLERFSAAVIQMQMVLELKPDFAEVHSNLGTVYRRLGRHEEAATHYRAAIRFKPSFAAAHHNFANLLSDQGDLEEAERHYRQAVRLNPQCGEIYNALGLLLAKLERHQEAEAAYLKALELEPQSAEAENNLGNTLMIMGRFDEAYERFHRAIQRKPHFAEAHNNLGLPLTKFSRLRDAEVCYRNALELDPNYAHAHLNLAVCWLSQGKFGLGWPEYEWRWRCQGAAELRHSGPMWDGEDLEGKTILVHYEQGLGDTLQFVRYIALLKQRGAHVVFECQPALVPLISRCSFVDHLVPRGKPIPDFDVHSPLLSLPGAFRTTLEDIPAEIPYLFADPDLVQHWRTKLSEGRQAFRVGIHWQGSPYYNGDQHRSIPLSQFSAIAEIAEIQLYSLQKNQGAEQLADFAQAASVVDLGNQLDVDHGAFMDSAAVLINLDLVITSDTALVHLAGGLGVPVWVPLGASCDWRWLTEREDSPWYPTVRLFRQARLGEWEPVFQRMAEELKNLLHANQQQEPVSIPISIGELVDKISILELKAERIASAAKQSNIQKELQSLRSVFRQSVESSERILALQAELKRVNALLWDVEEAIRVCDRDGDFGPRFVALAQSVYRENDRRAVIKRQIDQRLGSHWVEVKSYA